MKTTLRFLKTLPVQTEERSVVDPAVIGEWLNGKRIRRLTLNRPEKRQVYRQLTAKNVKKEQRDKDRKIGTAHSGKVL